MVMTASETLSQKYDRILSLCETGKKSGVYTQIRCPCNANHKHSDKAKSASLGLHSNGISFKCFAGCQTDDFLQSLGLTYRDMFPDSERTPSNIYTYHNADGSYHHDKVKYRDPATGKKDFRQRTIDDQGNIVGETASLSKIPFGMPRLLQAIRDNKVVVYTEGEKDALTARLLGYESTTMGGASDWKDEYKAFFKGSHLVLIPDKDAAGLKLSERMQESLASVTKSLRVVVLPEGKDLTEWVEAGHSDLAALIESSPELAKADDMSAPIITHTHSGYSFAWVSLGIKVNIDRLTDDCEGVISVTSNGQRVHVSKINLLAPRSLTELANKLTKIRKVNWELGLTAIAIYCNERQGALSELCDINQEPETMTIEYLLDPILPLGQPATIFAAGGKGKSTIADLIAVLVQYGVCAQGNLPFIPVQGNVLYLDWENLAETHRRYITAIKRGLNVTDHTPILYLEMEHPLTHAANSLRELIQERHIDLVIIDSQMAATAGGNRGLNEAQIASEYYNCLRSFGCTSLTIDHVTKSGMGDTDNLAAFGSIVKYNRSRSQWELKLPDEEDDNDHKEYALVHKKFNLGRKQKPIGVTVDFSNDGDTLTKIVFSSANIKTNPILSAKVLGLRERIRNALSEMGHGTAAEIAKHINELDKTDTIANALYRGTQGRTACFTHLPDGGFGLLFKE